MINSWWILVLVALLLIVGDSVVAVPFFEGDKCGANQMVSIDFAATACTNVTLCASIFNVSPVTPRSCSSAVTCAKAATNSQQYVDCRVYDGSCSTLTGSYTITSADVSGVSYFKATYYNLTGCTGASISEGLAPADSSCRGICTNALTSSNIFCTGSAMCYASASSAVSSALAFLL
jgi:hypothetical protein